MLKIMWETPDEILVRSDTDRFVNAQKPVAMTARKASEWLANKGLNPDEIEIPINAYLVAIDITDRHDIDDRDRPLIDKIVGVYLFDRNQCIYQCELTPCYRLIHVYNVLRPCTEISDADEDHIFDKYYDPDGGPDIRICRQTIDQMVDAPKQKTEQKTVHHYGYTGISFSDTPRTGICFDPTGYSDQMEFIRSATLSTYPL